MATTRKAAKKAPGRPRKAPDEKLEQFSVRLPPKLKFGLELLARAQHRSLSQAVEWAVQVGLNSFDVDNEGETLGSLLETAWAEQMPERRLLAIYQRAPTLLTFEERAVCELLSRSSDLAELYREAEVRYASRDRNGDIRPGDLDSRVDEIYWGTVLPHWKKMHKLAVDLANAGKPLQDVSAAVLLGFFDKPEYKRLGLWDVYEREAALAIGS